MTNETQKPAQQPSLKPSPAPQQTQSPAPQQRQGDKSIENKPAQQK